VRTPLGRPLVILPTYNEAENIEHVLQLVKQALPVAQVLVVDDGSPDGTADIAEKAGVDLGGGVNILRRAGKQGLGSAYRAGFRWGIEHGFDVLIEMDSDLQHDPASLPSLFDGLADAELVIGSRWVPGGSAPGWSKFRVLISRGGSAYSRLWLGLQVKDITAGYRAYRATQIEKIDLDAIKADGYGFQVEMTYVTSRTGGTIVEVPITFGAREKGTSKMSMRIVVEAMLLVTWWGVRDRILRRRSRG